MWQRPSSVLERILPADNSAIQAHVTSSIDGDGNGYQLLWNIAKLNIPIFDPTKLFSFPKWPGCIHRFARLFELCYELAQHRGQCLSFYDISEAFLENIRIPVYRNMPDARMVHLRTLVPINPQDGSLSHE